MPALMITELALSLVLRAGAGGRSLGVFWDALWLQRLRWEDEIIQDLRFGVRMLNESARVHHDRRAHPGTGHRHHE